MGAIAPPACLVWRVEKVRAWAGGTERRQVK